MPARDQSQSVISLTTASHQASKAGYKQTVLSQGARIWRGNTFLPKIKISPEIPVDIKSSVREMSGIVKN